MITSSGLQHSVWFTKVGFILNAILPQRKKVSPHTDHYITIELGVRDMPPEQSKTSLHKKNHVLLLCYHHNWHELEYITNRRDSIDVQMYHSQEGRYADIQ